MPDFSSLFDGWDFTRPWYHGSPNHIDILRAGSTITQDIALARVFSHKPAVVSLEDDPVRLAQGVPRLRHNGLLPGRLYQIAESLGPDDVDPHPRTSMPPALEWVTRRPLRLFFLEPVEILPGEFLTNEEIDDLFSRAK